MSGSSSGESGEASRLASGQPDASEAPTVADAIQRLVTLEALRHMVDSLASKIIPFERKKVLNYDKNPTHILQADLGPTKTTIDIYRQITAYDGMDLILQKISESFEKFPLQKSIDELAQFLAPILDGWSNETNPEAAAATSRYSVAPETKPLPLERASFVELFKQAAETMLRQELPKGKQEIRRLVIFSIRGGIASQLKEQ